MRGSGGRRCCCCCFAGRAPIQPRHRGGSRTGERLREPCGRIYACIMAKFRLVKAMIALGIVAQVGRIRYGAEHPFVPCADGGGGGSGDCRLGGPVAGTGTAATAAVAVARGTKSNGGDAAGTAAREIATGAEDDAGAGPDDPRVRFVFFVGLEGTGHHLVSSIVRQSPDEQYTDEVLQLRQAKVRLMRVLYGTNPGYLHMHCPNYAGTAARAGVGRNATAVQVARDEAVELMRRIAAKVEEGRGGGRRKRRGRRKRGVVTVPLNAAGIEQMASYPTDNDMCRSMKYPNLDVLYGICEEVGVDCRHVYLHRDPYVVLRSTTHNRPFNRHGTLNAAHMYTTLLNVIYSQLDAHSSKTLGCYGFYEDDTSSNRKNATATSATSSESTATSMTMSRGSWREFFRTFGWSSKVIDNDADPGKLGALIDSIYKPPEPMTDAERDELDLLGFRPFMESLSKAHERVIDLCRMQAAKNEKQ